MWVGVSQGGVNVTNVSPLPSPLFSEAPGEGINQGAACFGVGNLSNRFQDQGLDMPENLKAVEGKGKNLVLSRSCLWLLVSTADLTGLCACVK